MNYFEETYLRLRIEEQNIAVMEWLGLAKTEAYRKGYEKFAELLKEKKPAFWLWDCRGGVVIDVKDQKWTMDEWSAMVLNNATTYGNPTKVALVTSKDIFNKMAMRLIVSNIAQKGKVETAYFDTKEAAIEWLKTKTATNPMPPSVANTTS